MNKEDHLGKAKEIEDSLSRLRQDLDWALIIEGIYNSSLQYIAYYCETKYNDHTDIHAGLEKYLRNLGETNLERMFSELNHLRMGRWYGGKKNGESAKRAFEIMNAIKEEALGVKK
jgi:hypothetical protein